MLTKQEESELISAINRGDAASAMAYADALEQAGLVAHAELVRSLPEAKLISDRIRKAVDGVLVGKGAGEESHFTVWMWLRQLGWVGSDAAALQDTRRDALLASTPWGRRGSIGTIGYELCGQRLDTPCKRQSGHMGECDPIWPELPLHESREADVP